MMPMALPSIAGVSRGRAPAAHEDSKMLKAVWLACGCLTRVVVALVLLAVGAALLTGPARGGCNEKPVAGERISGHRSATDDTDGVRATPLRA